MVNSKQFVDFLRGTIPIIISVPHGGTLRPPEIPDRTSGVLGTDKNTRFLAQGLIERMRIELRDVGGTITTGTPSYIISRIHRSKIDLNREKTDAYDQESSMANEIYSYYHDTLKKMIVENVKSFNYSLLVDVHGFERHKRPSGYRDVEVILGTNNLSSLFSKPVLKSKWGENIRGAIIKRLLELSIEVAPGRPRRKEYVLTGGYITSKYGASNIVNSQAIQMEFSDRIRLYDEELRTKVVRNLAKLLINDYFRSSNL